MKTFETLLGKEHAMLASVEERGYEKPSEIQDKSIQTILSGVDVIAGASTGSGKTLAFAAGLINSVKKDYGVQGLVLTPTRELAEQVAREIGDFAKYANIRICAVYGGVPMQAQIRQIPTSEIIVGTPGRILDHLERHTLDLSHIKTAVLDEADRMFDMGFKDDVIDIISHCPTSRQTMLFSATINNEVVALAQKYMRDPVEISAKPHVDPNKLKQIYYDVPDNLKYSLLKHLLEQEKSSLVMIFCNTRKNVDFIANNLQRMGIEALPLHGGYTQDKRNRILAQFHSRKANILVATDVAARGLDIQGVSHVYNYDIPLSQDEYIHRIGRTARAGEDGQVVNILSSRDYDNFSNLKRSNFVITPEELPYVEHVQIKWIPERRQGNFNRRGTSNGRGNGQGNRRGNDRNYSRGNNRDDRRTTGTNSRRDTSYSRNSSHRDSRRKSSSRRDSKSYSRR